jgi:hypothetical protein
MTEPQANVKRMSSECEESKKTFCQLLFWNIFGLPGDLSFLTKKGRFQHII